MLHIYFLFCTFGRICWLEIDTIYLEKVYFVPNEISNSGYLDRFIGFLAFGNGIWCCTTREGKATNVKRAAKLKRRIANASHHRGYLGVVSHQRQPFKISSFNFRVKASSKHLGHICCHRTSVRRSSDLNFPSAQRTDFMKSQKSTCLRASLGSVSAGRRI
ncbi:Protein of unknown function [Pyronema omphalodes CBS 100304]|uniref:Secreted protein n=1 Tax=Pyronema omphalodes (strain CBS 100304) TaxID=1076935 RepID=U4L8Z0_PYROM|nr:Protein of unknown function [Pyronema omphalodes CBS 100304]